jgi:hypothetical protein
MLVLRGISVRQNNVEGTSQDDGRYHSLHPELRFHNFWPATRPEYSTRLEGKIGCAVELWCNAVDSGVMLWIVV